MESRERAGVVAQVPAEEFGPEGFELSRAHFNAVTRRVGHFSVVIELDFVKGLPEGQVALAPWIIVTDHPTPMVRNAGCWGNATGLTSGSSTESGPEQPRAEFTPRT